MGTYTGKAANPAAFTGSTSYHTVAYCFSGAEAKLYREATTLEGLAAAALRLAEASDRSWRLTTTDGVWHGPPDLDLHVERLPQWLRTLLRALRLPRWVIWALPTEIAALLVGADELMRRIKDAMAAGSCPCPAGKEGFCICVTYWRPSVSTLVLFELPIRVEGCPSGCTFVMPAGCP